MMANLRPSLFFNDLCALAEKDYSAFTAKLVPNIPPERILGVRIPALRNLAKGLIKDRPDDVAAFLADLPHDYFDENNLHGLLLAEIKDMERVIAALNLFLPYVDNWATCDIISPKAFKRQRDALLPAIRRWMASDREYTIRFGVEMLMTHYMAEDFDPAYLEWVAALRHDAYYVKMMVAWYFATALTKQYESAMPFIEGKHLDSWTRNKAIQKARESRLIPAERKDALQALKRKA